jgi:hypothetical protein
MPRLLIIRRMRTYNVHQTIQLAGYNNVAQSIPVNVLDRIVLRKNIPFRYSGTLTEEMMSTLFTFGKTELTFRFLKKGSFGSVFSAVAQDPPREVLPFVVKIQNSTEQAKRGLKSAEKLRKCGIVSFKTFELGFTSPDPTGEQFRSGTCLATFMDRCTGDCLNLVLTTDEDRGAFALFLITLLDCLKDQNLTYTDMKPDNIGYMKLGKSYRFRLLDLDGTNNKVSTYPAISNWTTTFEPRHGSSQYDQMLFQTAFASAITKMMVCGSQEYRKRVHAFFYHEVFLPRASPGQVYARDPFWEQLRFLEGSDGKGHEFRQVRDAANNAISVLTTAHEWQLGRIPYLELPHPD